MSEAVLVLAVAAAILLIARAWTRAGLRDPDRRPPLPRRRMRRQFVARAMTVGGLERHCLVYVPTSLRPGRQAPLVVALHGGGGDPRSFARMTRLHYLAEREGFLLAYPAGTGPHRARRLTWNAGGESVGWAERHRVDDVAFVRALIDDIARFHAIDGRRIFAIGASKGGMLAYHLACTCSDVFAAVAVVAGSMVSRGCAPRAPVAVLHVHGGRDENVPLRGGRGRRTAHGNVWPPVEEGLAFWRRHNGCTGDRRETYRDAGTACWRSVGRDHGDVEFCLVADGGHGWPGSRPGFWQWLFRVRVAGAFPTNRMAWRFFVEHPKPDAAARSR
ncbi:MAG: alpha/beta hydrolase family esterase [Rhodospirillales bacterium]